MSSTKSRPSGRIRCRYAGWSSPLRGIVRLALLAAIVMVAVLWGFVFAPQAQAAVSYNPQEIAFVKLLNDYRVAHNIQPLLVSDAMSLASKRHGSDMGKYKFFGHTTVQSDWFPVGSASWDRMRLCGYNYYTAEAEIIAAGQSTADAVFQVWKGSATHNADMLSANYKVLGIGFVTVTGSPYTYYWVADFGGIVDPTAHTLSTVGATRYQQTNTNIVKVGTWYNYAKTLASGGGYGRSCTSGALATVYFIGTRLDWIAMKGTTTGIADVYLDGVKKATINLASSTAIYNVKVWSTGTLSYGSHTVKLVRSSRSAAGKYLTLDAVDIWGTIKAAR